MSDVQPGDLLQIDTESGPKLVQITHVTTPYPPVLRALKGDTAEADTAFIAMADLQADDPRVTPLANAAIPPEARAFPTFRLAVRDRTGQPVYWWYWNGEGLRLAPDPADMSLPLRQITRFETLITALSRI